MNEIREIEAADNPAIAALIRSVMTEFKTGPESTILGDPSLNSMFENYQTERAVYYVVFSNKQLAGGCGIKALEGSTEDICELQRLFLKPELRGKGVGKQLMELCLRKAVEFGYREIYLETLAEMESALALYRKYGFEKICQPKGNTGHGGCDLWLSKKLQAGIPAENKVN